jgi:hypothetical protein
MQGFEEKSVGYAISRSFSVDKPGFIESHGCGYPAKSMLE